MIARRLEVNDSLLARCPETSEELSENGICQFLGANPIMSNPIMSNPIVAVHFCFKSLLQPSAVKTTCVPSGQALTFLFFNPET